MPNFSRPALSAASVVLTLAWHLAFLDGSQVYGEEFHPIPLQTRIQSAIQQTLSTTVAITQRRDGGAGAFSGVIVSNEGHILSVGHTVTPGAEYTVHLTDRRQFRARGLGVNEQADLGMIKIIDSGTWPVAVMGYSSSLVPDQPCLSISHPGMYDSNRGPVVRLGRVIQTISPMQGMIQTTALMEPGDSGGALFDIDGRLIGIHSQIQQPLDQNFEVPVDSYRLYWEDLNKPERFEIDRVPGLPAIGFSGRRSRQQRGVRVVEIDEGGAAELAGLKLDDTIIRLDGGSFESSRTLNHEIVARYLRGDRTFRLTVVREDDESEIVLKLTDAEFLDGKSSVQSTGLRPIQGQPMKALRNLRQEFAALESKLDDACVKVISSKNERQSETLATLIAGTDKLISKSSSVLDNPQMLMTDGSLHALKVLARSDQNDLILMQSNAKSDSGISLTKSTPSITSQDLGRWMVAPHPMHEGTIGILGSRPFESIRRESRGYLGVNLLTYDGKVVIESVLRRRAASRIGLRDGDIILAVDDVRPTQHEQVRNYLGRQLPETEVRLTIDRDGEQFEKTAVLEPAPAPRHIAEAFDGGKSPRRDGFYQVICHDAPLLPHECGGPLFDGQGNFVGINIARHSRTHCYAIPTYVLESFVNSAP